MSLAVLIPTRGRNGLLANCAGQMWAACSINTQFVLGWDTDDVRSGVHFDPLNFHLSVEPREDTLGAKYNRCAAVLPNADIYLLWADDMVITTNGFDKIIEDAAAQFTDGIGMVFFGKIEGVMQPGIAVTRKMVELMGELCDPSYAFWFQDTRLIEIGRMTDRVIDLGNTIEVKCLTELKGNSRGVRDIAFWGQYFDATRPKRRAIAERIIEAGADQPYRKTQLRKRMNAWDEIFRQANSKCSDPVQAKQLEAHYAFDAPADERYLRVKAKAEAELAKMQQVAA